MSYDDNDTPAIRRNIKKARRQWGQFRKLLERDSVPARVAGMYYQAVIASVLLYGSESWVVSPSTLRELEGFHVEAARRLTDMRPLKIKGLLVYPHSPDVLATAHLQPIACYIQKRQHTVYNTIRGRDVLKECEGAEWRRGTPPCLFWAEQDMTVPERLDYGAEGEGSTHTPPASRARMAPQARPTIAEERPREAMSVTDAATEARWRAAHINSHPVVAPYMAPSIIGRSASFLE